MLLAIVPLRRKVFFLIIVRVEVIKLQKGNKKNECEMPSRRHGNVLSEMANAFREKERTVVNRNGRELQAL